MQPVFTRLNCSSTKEVLQELWDRRLIALHYEDSFSLNPDDYPTAGKHALSRLHRYAREGAIVAADFRKLYRARLLVGEIEPGSQLRAEKFGGRYVYKVAQLTNCREVLYTAFPVLLAIQPRQGTLVGWPSANAVLRSALYGNPLPIEVSSLSPDQFEVVCYEYLRAVEKINRLLMPIGRGLIDIDIFGIDGSDRTVLAQVTQSRNTAANKEKIENLLAHGEKDSKLYFFGIGKNIPDSPGVEVLDITEVFNDVLDDKESRKMVFRMLGLPSEEVDRESVGRPDEIPNEDLKLEDVPSDTAPIHDIEMFALTFMAFDYWDVKDKAYCGEIDGVCDCLSHLRTELYWMQRAGRHGNGMSRNEAIPILKGIRQALEKNTKTWC